MICKQCGTELHENKKENYPFCPRCRAERGQQKTGAPDIFMTTPPDFTTTSEKEAKLTSPTENKVDRLSGLPDETIPPQSGKKPPSPVLIPPSGPPPKSFFRRTIKRKGGVFQIWI